MNVGVLTTCHTQYTSDSSICFFLFNRTTLQVYVTYSTGALYVHHLWFYRHQHDNRVRSACQRWWFQWRFWFVPSVPGYLQEEEAHKPDPWRNPIERNHMGLHPENEVAVVKTPTIISNNPVYIYIYIYKPPDFLITKRNSILSQYVYTYIYISYIYICLSIRILCSTSSVQVNNEEY